MLCGGESCAVMVADLRISQLLYGLSQGNGRWRLLLTTEQIHGDEREEKAREVPLEERRRGFGTTTEPTRIQSTALQVRRSTHARNGSAMTTTIDTRYE